jgi:hypothetical protein
VRTAETKVQSQEVVRHFQGAEISVWPEGRIRGGKAEKGGSGVLR